jgi:hypothetical protein
MSGLAVISRVFRALRAISMLSTSQKEKYYAIHDLIAVDAHAVCCDQSDVSGASLMGEWKVHGNYLALL